MYKKDTITKPMLPLAIGVSLIALVTGCSSIVSKEHHVRKGNDPRYQDVDVAFRTTYYFRVFDHCAAKKASDNSINYAGVPDIDSFYRFTMTGKSDTLYNKIRFESGTLKSWELDPIGAAVIFDENIGRFRFQSRAQTDVEVLQKTAWSDYKKLLNEYRNLKAMNVQNGQSQIKEISEKLNTTLLGLFKFGTPLIQDNNDAMLRAISEGVDEHKGWLSALNSSLYLSLTSAAKKRSAVVIEAIEASTRTKVIHTSANWLDNKLKKNIAENKSKSPPVQTTVQNILKDIKQEDLAKEIKQISSSDDKADSSENIAKIILEDSGFNDAVRAYISTPSSSIFLERIKTLNLGKKNLRALAKPDLIKAFLLGLNTTIKEEMNKVQRSDIPSSILMAIQQAMDEKLRLAVGVTESSQTKLESQLRNLSIEFEKSKGKGDEEIKSVEDTLKSLLESRRATIDCSGDLTQRRGFQILGPEGWRTFDPDERLIMAMRTSAEPLTSTLNQISQRVLKAHEGGKESLTPLVEARLHVSEAQRKLDRVKISNQTTTDSIKRSLNLCETVNSVSIDLAANQETSLLPANSKNEKTSSPLKCKEMFK